MDKQLLTILLVIGSGSFIGGIFRYLLSLFIQARFMLTFPFGTLSVNLIGCLLIGLLFGLSDKWSLTQEWRLFLVTGLLGGFTTFSAFSIETVNLLQDGQLGHATAYVTASVVLGVLAAFIGMAITRLF
jgi:fluoride exporter